MKIQTIRVTSQIACVACLTLRATVLRAGNDTWDGGGGDNNWNTALNWTAGSANRPPATGDALFFDGSTQLTANNNDSGFTFAGLTFNSTAGAFTLTGNSFTASAGLVDDSPNLETINLPIAFSTLHSVNVISGGSLTINNVISGTGTYVLTKSGGGLLTLTGEAGGANTYGPTAINAGSLLLDFSQGGSTPTVNIVTNAALTLSGGTLLVNGSASGANSQSFTSTTLPAAATAIPGQNIISVTNGASGGTATVNLGSLTVNLGSSLVFNGPATIGQGSATVAATGIITTTTQGTGPTTAGVYGLLATGDNNNAYATVGLYDWASTSTTGDGGGTSPYTIIGGSQVPGFYVVPANNSTLGGNNYDIATQQTPSLGGTGNVRNSSGTAYTYAIRFNSGNAPYIEVKSGDFFEPAGVLVTPNMGIINCGIDIVRVGNSTCQIVQNNTSGVFCLGLSGGTTDGPFFSNTGGTPTDTVVISGQGAVFLNPVSPMHIAFNYTNSANALATSTSTYYDSAARRPAARKHPSTSMAASPSSTIPMCSAKPLPRTNPPAPGTGNGQFERRHAHVCHRHHRRQHQLGQPGKFKCQPRGVPGREWRRFGGPIGQHFTVGGVIAGASGTRPVDNRYSGFQRQR